MPHGAARRLRSSAAPSTGPGLTETTRATEPETAWGPAEVARELKISERHLLDIRRELTDFPEPLWLGRVPRWSPSVIREYVARASQPTPPARRSVRKGGGQRVH